MSEALTGLLRGEGGNKGLFINTLRPHRFQARELASTFDEGGLGGLSSSGQAEVWLHAGEKLRKLPERRNYVLARYQARTESVAR
jgi:hypothetical protein